jgi:hypothetical protein
MCAESKPKGKWFYLMQGGPKVTFRHDGTKPPDSVWWCPISNSKALSLRILGCPEEDTYEQKPKKLPKLGKSLA